MRPHDPHVSGVEESDPDALGTILVGLIGAVVVVVVVVLLQGLYESVQRAENRRKVIEETPQELHALQVRQLEKLHATAWVDKAGGVVTIPLDQAMEILIRDPNARAAPPPAAPPPVVPPPPGTAAR